MKKVFFITTIFAAIFFGCNKKAEDIPSAAYETKVNFYNVSKTGVAFIDAIAKNQTIDFDIFLSKANGADIAVSIEKASQSTATGAQYSLSTNNVTIPAGELKASAQITYNYEAFEVGDTTELVLILSSSQVNNGHHDTLKIVSTKIGNPLKTVFPGDWWAHYWDPSETIGDYDAGWGNWITLSFNENDPSGSSMIMNNLWWGGEDILVNFDLENGTLSIEDNQVVDQYWAQDGYTLPWVIKNTTDGTFDIASTKLEFYYEIFGSAVNHYGSYNCWIDE